MNNRNRITLAVALTAGLVGGALAQPSKPSAPAQPSPPAAEQHPHPQATAQNIGEMKFGAIPGLPTCVKGAVEDGDPTQGPSILMGKISTGCTIPWHFHTPNEHVMIVSGAARVQMKDEKPVTLRAGGYAMMPTKHIHQFTCTESCMIFIYSDAKFDIHYVDPQGNEISPDEALKPLKESTTAMR